MAEQGVQPTAKAAPVEQFAPYAPAGPAAEVPGSQDAAGGEPFVGRDRELAELLGDMERAGLHTLSGRPSPHSRVLLIAGRPGSGRTALAEAFVRRPEVAERFPGGVLRARLTAPGGAPVPTERTARELLTALDSDPVPAGAGEDELTEALRAALAQRRVLLLLDDVARPWQVLDLLPDNRRCLVLAVAAGPLTGVPDVRPCALGGLGREAAVALLASRAGAPHRTTVDPRSAESVAQACGDLPAALALVGGWLAARPKLSVADAARQLGGMPDADPLERAFRLVGDSLAQAPARVLRLLSMAPDGLADEQAASALAGCSTATAQRILEQFLQLGLLRTEPAQPGRYALPRCLDPLLRAELAERERAEDVLLARARMLERTVRQLQACHAVTEPEGSDARQRLARLPRTLRFGSAAAARDWLAVRRPALLAAARLAVEEGEGRLDTLARRLISALARAFDAHRPHPEAAPDLYQLHALALGVAERGGLQRERAAALLNLGDLYAGTGRYSQALARYRAALDAAREGRAGRDAPDQLLTGRAMESIGSSYEDLGDRARAADWYGRALVLHQTRDARAAAARLHGRLGALHGRDGCPADALREWRAAAANFRRLGDLQAHARALAEIAQLQERDGR